MGPYRAEPTSLASMIPPRGLAFPSARVRLGAERFELSFWDWGPLLDLAMGLVVLVPVLPLLPLRIAIPIAVLSLFTCIGPRVSFVVSRQSSWAVWTVFGVSWRRRELGRNPLVENNGWDWSEIAILPSDLTLRKGLHDDERVVLAEWGDGHVHKTEDARHLIALTVWSVRRLHGARVD